MPVHIIAIEMYMCCKIIQGIEIDGLISKHCEEYIPSYENQLVKLNLVGIKIIDLSIKH